MVPEMVIGGVFIVAVILFATLAASAQRSRRAGAGADGSAGWVHSGDGCDPGADSGCDGGGGGGD
jgi:hypothetical protein